MYYEILYSSVATSHLERSELIDIAEISQRNNIELGVSGMLIYNNREFLQLLEGPREKVVSLMNKISEDPRHASIRIIWQHDIENKGFEKWDMGFVDMDDNDELLTGEYDQYTNESFAKISESEYATTGKSLLQVLTKKLGA